MEIESGIIKTFHISYCNTMYESYWDYDYNLYSCCCDAETGHVIKKIYFQNNGIIEGVYKKFWSNGNIVEISNYIGDLKNDEYKTYYQNGKLKKECEYKNDQLNGICKEYNIYGVFIS